MLRVEGLRCRAQGFLEHGASDLPIFKLYCSTHTHKTQAHAYVEACMRKEACNKSSHDLIMFCILQYGKKLLMHVHCVFVLTG